MKEYLLPQISIQEYQETKERYSDFMDQLLTARIVIAQLTAKQEIGLIDNVGNQIEELSELEESAEKFSRDVCHLGNYLVN